MTPAANDEPRKRSRLRPLLCVIGIHKWSYIPNAHGGRPMVRQCECCPMCEAWDYNAAREGLIVWRQVYPPQPPRGRR